jgi:serine phosphatase RsbU (regulator of sigma subunit)
MTEARLAIKGKVDGRTLRRELPLGVVVLGRAPDCDIVLKEGSISRRHAEIRYEDESFLLRDLGSRNGTRLNGSVVASPTPLRPGDRITLATLEFAVEGTGAASVDTSDVTRLTFSDSTPPTGAEVSWHEVEALRGDRMDRRERRDRRALLFRVMVEGSELLSAAREPQELYEPVLDLVETAFMPERAALLCLDENGEPKVVGSRVRENSSSKDDIVLSRTVVRRVVNEKVSLLIEEADLGGSANLMQSIVAQGIRAAMAVPLVDENRVMGLLYADTTEPAVHYTRDDLKAFTLLASVVGTALTHARVHSLEEEKRRLDTELDAARNILASILPAHLPECPGYELCALLDSCYEVGGDLYDFISLDDGRLLIMAGDVAGKGLGAALLVSSIVPVVHTLVESDRDPTKLVTRLNRHLWRTTDTSRFATLFLGVLDPKKGRLEYVNAGHNPPYLLGADGSLQNLDATAPPVGLLEEIAFPTATIELKPGMTLVLYSDGISEAATPQDEFYGEGRFERRLRELAGASASDLMAAALADLEDFLAGEPPADDVTLVLLKRA